jgi:serine/threonine protein phosphatase 1
MSDRFIAIGDIHGCSRTLRRLIEDEIHPQATDTLLLVGDYIDRGPDSKGVIEYLMGLEKTDVNCLFLRGNHEQTLLDCFEAEKTIKRSFFGTPKNKTFEAWYESYGGKQTFDSYGIKELKDFPPDHLEWMAKTRLYLETETHLFAHAGFNFEQEDIFTDTHAMMWIRDFEYNKEKARGKKVIHGHVPVTLDFFHLCLSKPELGFVPLDTGCVYSQITAKGYLTALDVNTLDVFSTKNIDLL